MKTLYHVYNPNDENRVDALFSETVPQYVINHTCNGEIDPKYDLENDIIFDGASLEQQAEEIQQLENEIISRYNYLMMRALSSSMGKYGSFEYLQNQKLEYDDKYLVAKGLKSSAPIELAIQKEMERDFSEAILDATLTAYGLIPTGTQLQKMHQLIVFRYEYAQNRYETFKGFVIDFRTKCRTFIELQEFDKLYTAFSMVDTLPLELTDLEIQNFYNSFDAL